MTTTLSLLSSTLLAFATGTASALLPVINAEVYAVAVAGRSQPGLALVLVVCLAMGQTLGKLLLFETARRGGGRLGRWVASRQTERGKRRTGRWSPQIKKALGSRRTGHPLVLVSAALGLPPLAAISLAAGASGQRRWEFGALCLLGRTARFAVLTLPAAYALS
jgi:membrane protein YqaA with SNARE-associated domain